MANTNILNLPVAVDLDGSEYFPLVQGGITKRATTGQIVTLSTDIQTLLDGISSTQGAVLYRGAAAWAALTPGTSGQVLTTGGAAANPSWSNVSFSAQSANTVLAGPTSGGAAVPTFRALVAADLPGTVLVWGS